MAQTTGSGPPAVAQSRRNQVLTRVLKGVSRSFYLTLRVLPKALREPIGLAYLLARAADTIADTKAVPAGQRMERLSSLRQQVRGPADTDVLSGIVSQVMAGSPSEKELAMFASLAETFSLLESLAAADLEQVRQVVVMLSQGMEMDLSAFPAEDSGEVAALASAADLDRYTYLVAGCVGEFWTRVSAAHQASLKDWNVGRMSETGVRFGKALQLTNVLRDLPRDLRLGRCYLPADELAVVGLTPRDLLDPANEGRVRPVLAAWVRTALGHFGAAEEYLLAIPRRSVRLRLACLWPLLLGLGTLGRAARNGAWLDPGSTA
ncbi:MAG: phytoene/squalene synthase family protein, partial [Chloroflexi bacterium]|nr:phytoene/squalene synthase family protein [Chloroflexota bacterium]